MNPGVNGNRDGGGGGGDGVNVGDVRRSVDVDVVLVVNDVTVSMTGPNPSSISTLTSELRSSGGSISSSSD